MNKKIVIALGIVILIVVGFILLTPVSAPCKYKGGNEAKICTANLVLIPRWKLLLFDLTGVNAGYGYF